MFIGPGMCRGTPLRAAPGHSPGPRRTHPTAGPEVCPRQPGCRGTAAAKAAPLRLQRRAVRGVVLALRDGAGPTGPASSAPWEGGWGHGERALLPCSYGEQHSCRQAGNAVPELAARSAEGSLALWRFHLPGIRARTPMIARVCRRGLVLFT